MKTGVSTTGVRYDLSGRPSAIPRLILPLAITMMLLVLLSSGAKAQYRGGRRPPEPALKRSGLLFVEAGFIRVAPGRDFSSPAGGAASDGAGWRVNLGTWFGKRFTGEVEFGVFDNDRYSLTDPWNLGIWPNITRMDFRNTYLLPMIRLNLMTDRRVIPFVVGGIGTIRSEFSIHFIDFGQTLKETSSQRSTLLSVGAGVNVVIANHTTLVVEWRSLDWFNDALIPGIRYWAASRVGIGLSWHF